jgi:hypothetical protein
LTKLFIASLLLRARRILVIVIWSLEGIYCARNLLKVSFFALLLQLLFLSTGHGASHQIRTRRKLTLNLGDFLDFKGAILDVLLYPLHLG